MERLRFLTDEQVRQVRNEFGSPVYVYDQRTLEQQAQAVLDMPNAFGMTARYAMKALPSGAVVRLFSGMGLHIDASSEFEAARAMACGVPAGHIQITAQQMPANLAELLDAGVLFTACSLEQLKVFGALRPGGEACIRVNPGLGSGHSKRTNVGGPSASFGIWHEYLDQALDVQRLYGLRITRLHTHIGSGSNPKVWRSCARMTLDIAARFPEVETVSLGGGFKVGRMADEESTDLRNVGEEIAGDFRAFHQRNGRKLRLEIEPGTFLAANAGAVVCTVIDVADTGAGGYAFIKVDSGMTEVVRAAMYGAQHPLVVVPATPEDRGRRYYLVAGHCCESGDVLTPEPGNPEGLRTRELLEARIGDALVIDGAGAYCASMSSKNYNSFPEAPEVLLTKDGAFQLIRRRQTIEQIVQNEIY